MAPRILGRDSGGLTTNTEGYSRYTEYPRPLRPRLAVRDKIADAERAYRDALPICKDLAAHFQQPADYGEILVNCSFGLAHVLVITGRTQEAKEVCHSVLQVGSKNPGARDRLAWLL